jgi:hypothetical protein
MSAMQDQFRSISAQVEKLTTTDNAVVIAARTSEWADSILIDEYHHGFGQRRDMLPLIGAFLVSPWGFVCMQLALAGAIFMLGTRRRFGSRLR